MFPKISGLSWLEAAGVESGGLSGAELGHIASEPGVRHLQVDIIGSGYFACPPCDFLRSPLLLSVAASAAGVGCISGSLSCWEGHQA